MKNLISLIALTLVASVFAGCSKQSRDTAPTAQTNSVTQGGTNHYRAVLVNVINRDTNTAPQTNEVIK